ncbi:MAG: CotH kinase family protein, partial [Planctomycetes bacterium]|nr:CotH kinase family protein [Planctomycetota bacterium]
MAARGRYSRGLRPLWRMRPLTGIALSLPVLFVGIWYGWRAAAAHEAFRRTSGEAVPLTTELFHLHLHDRIRIDLRRLSVRRPPAPPALPVYSLTLSRSDLQALASGLSADTERAYVPCFASKGGPSVRAKVRVRGGQPWHWAYPQKSLKIAVEKEPGQGPDDEPYLDGEKTLNLINEVSPLGVGEDVILDVLGDLGVMTPEHGLARVTVNRRPMGVYFFTGQANEDLLRKNGRVYGSLYSGDKAPADPKTGVSTLWREPKAWKKVASWRPEEGKDRSEIDRLLWMVNNAPPADFARFAREELDLGRFAAYDAVDVVFGGNQHDWDQDHKLFFDPYRGRWEPVAENFRGWANPPALQAA